MNIVYQARNGAVFKTMDKCSQYEIFLNKVSELKDSILPRKLDTSAFANGGGYIPIGEKKYAIFIKQTHDLIKLYHNAEWAEMFKEDPKGNIGRYLDEGNSPIYSLWRLINQIDDQYRLWGQPYYAKHPWNADNFVLKETPDAEWETEN